MTASVAEFLERLRQANSLEEFDRARLSPGEREALAHCAVPLTFDRALYENVLGGAAREEWPEFEEFVEREWCESVPAREGFHRLRESRRREHLDQWLAAGHDPAPLRRLAKRLAGLYDPLDPGAALDHLAALIFADPDAAAKRFAALYQEADAGFNLAFCEDLLTLVRDREGWLGGGPLSALAADYASYLEARAFWASEYHQTGWFYERPALTRSLDTLLDGDSGAWFWEIYAAGGMGKTMFLNWAIARHCVPHPRRIPCARIDFSGLELADVDNLFLRLLLQAGAQLTQQLPGDPFRSLLETYKALLPGGEESAAPARKTAGAIPSLHLPGDAERRGVFEAVADRLQHVTRPVLLVFDTLEEAILRRSEELHKLLLEVARLHERAPNLRVILASRFCMRERVEGFDQLKGYLVTTKIPHFTDDEARGYLLSKRRLRPAPVIDLVVRRAEKLPFKLALLADILRAKPALTVEELAAYPDNVNLIYLVERVLEQITPAAQWMLRYGVVPRRLTADFAREVMWPHLQEALSGAGEMAFDDPRKDIPRKIRRRHEIWPRRLAQPLTPEEMWQNLLVYATGYSWVRTDDDGATLVFHSEVAEPMRSLLHTHPINALLHRRAEGYYHALADQHAASAGEWMREAAFHRFHCLGAAGGDSWQRLIVSAYLRPHPEWRRLLAQDLLGSDFLTEKNEPRMLPEDGGPLVDHATLARAAFEAARAELELSTDEDSIRRSNDFQERAKAFEAISRQNVIHPVEWTRQTAAVERLRKSPALARQTLARCVRELLADGAPRAGGVCGLLRAQFEGKPGPPPHERRLWFDLGMDYAELTAELMPGEAAEEYHHLLEWSSGFEVSNPDRRRIHEALGRLRRANGKPLAAIVHFQEALRLTDAQSERAKWWLLKAAIVQGHLETNNLHQAFSCADLLPDGDPTAFHEPVNPECWEFIAAQVETQLALRDPEAALERCEAVAQASSPGDGEHAGRRYPRHFASAALARFSELRGRARRELMLFEDALGDLRWARSLWRLVGDAEGAARCLLEILEFHLDGTGSLRRAVPAAEQAQKFIDRHEAVSGTLRTRLVILRSRLDLRLGAEPRRAHGQLRSAERRLSKEDGAWRPRAQLVVQRIALLGENAMGELLALLRRVEPPAVRLPLIDPLFGKDLPPLSTREQVRLCRILIEPALDRQETRDFPLDAVRALSAMRWLSEPFLRKCQAAGILEKAVAALDRGRQWPLWRALLEAAQWMPGWHEAVRKAWRSFVGRDQDYPALIAAMCVESAEHALERQDLETPPEPEWLKARLPAQDASQWSARLWALCAQLEADAGRAAQAARQAVVLFVELGDGVAAQEAAKRDPGERGVPSRTVSGQAQDPAVKMEITLENGLLGIRLCPPGGAAESYNFWPGRPLNLSLSQRSLAPSAALMKHWDDQAENLAKTFRRSECLKRLFQPASAPCDLELVLPAGPLAGFPWELWLRSDEGLLVDAPGLRYFHRSGSHFPSFPGEGSHGDILVVIPDRKELRQSLYSIQGSMVVNAYRRAGRRVVVIEDPAPGQIASLLDGGRSVQAVHFCASLRYDGELDECHLDFDALETTAWQTGQRRVPGRFSYSALAGELSAPPSSSVRPLIVLDIRRPISVYEGMSQLLLRNTFAADLHRYLTGSPVLATGLCAPPQHQNLLTALIEGLDAQQPVGAIAARLQRLGPAPEAKTAWWDESFLHAQAPRAGVALFADQPSRRAGE